MKQGHVVHCSIILLRQKKARRGVARRYKSAFVVPEPDCAIPTAANENLIIARECDR